MAYPSRYFKQKNFTRAVLGGSELADITPAMDAEFKNAEIALQQLNDVVRGITTADGRLKNVAAAISLALAGTQRFSATSGQTSFVTTIEWDTAFNTTNVVPFINGIRLDSDSIVDVDDDGNGFLEVTLAAQTLGAVVIIMAYSSGAGVLSRLASAANGDGASLIALEDVANLYVASNVEDALSEVIGALNDYIDEIGDLTGLIFADGRNDFTADQDMGGFKITGLADGTADDDAVTYGQISAYIDVWNDLSAQFLALTGTGSGAMTGPIEMGDNNITGVADAVDPQDVPSLSQVEALIAAALSTQQPIGTVIDFAGAAIPSGFLECNGDAVSRTTYAALFAVLGTTWGAGDSVTTFNIPDFRGRMSMGAGTGPATGEGDVAGTARTLADVGGYETHTQIVAEIAAHGHTGGTWSGSYMQGGGGAAAFNGGTWTDHSHANDNAGSSTPMDIMNPFTVLKKAIKF